MGKYRADIPERVLVYVCVCAFVVFGFVFQYIIEYYIVYLNSDLFVSVKQKNANS